MIEVQDASGEVQLELVGRLVETAGGRVKSQTGRQGRIWDETGVNR